MTLQGNNLYVAGLVGTTHVIAVYDATTGTLLKPNVALGLSASPAGIAVGGNHLFVSASFDHIAEYDATTGNLIASSFATVYEGGSLAIFGGDLLCAPYDRAPISEFDATTGAPVNSDFVSLQRPDDGVFSFALQLQQFQNHRPQRCRLAPWPFAV